MDTLFKTQLASHSVASFYVQCLLSSCRNCGLDAEQLIVLSNLSRTKLENPEARYFLAELRDLWNYIVEISSDPCIGMKIGQNMPAGHWGLIETMAQNSENLGQAFKTALKYWRLVTDTGKQFKLERLNGQARLSFISAYYDFSYANESDIAYLIRLLKLILGQDVTLQEVHLTHAIPGQLSESDYQPYFQAPVYFGQSENAVVFAEDILDRPIVGSNSQIRLIVDQLAAKKLDELNSATTLSEKVRAYIQHDITELESVAEQLHISSRTLQRRLKLEGNTFQSILDEFRRDKAQRLMMDGTYTFQQISFLIGYRDERAFYDAVRRWFNASRSEAAQRFRTNNQA
ncbi:MAG: hypothetical protein CMK89_00725 [Pseudomonadales bacterium]|nr:hypothetical protein [Pseudomonadales bacterium]